MYFTNVNIPDIYTKKLKKLYIQSWFLYNVLNILYFLLF